MREWTYSSAVDLAQALRARQISSLELTQHAIARMARYEPKINAICTPNFDRALEAARAADAAIAAGETHPLLGVPIVIKESFNWAGVPTTWGLPFAKSYYPDDDALPVQRLKAAGAVILGKTNVPPALADWQSYNDLFGVTNNPYDLARTPGGSSGGSAAALAAGYVPFALGSDLGGSLRAPALFSGVTAHKPSWGLCPLRGHEFPFVKPLPGDLDFGVIGPMARTVKDLALGLDVLAGPDPLDDSVAYKLALPPPRHDALKDFRILVLEEHPLTPTSAAIKSAIAKVEKIARKGGAHIERRSALLLDLALTGRLFMQLYRATLSGGTPPDEYAKLVERAKGLDPFKDGLNAELVRGATMSHRDWNQADLKRRMVKQEWRALFEQFDAVICPNMLTPAFKHDHAPNTEARTLQVDGKAVPYMHNLLWPSVATFAGLPATAIPTGFTAEGLPVGVQIIAPYLEDRTGLMLAALLERELGGFAPPKGFA